ncbi:helix-turn-helix domain-containing protein [Enterobacteriaceae bacterium C23F]
MIQNSYSDMITDFIELVSEESALIHSLVRPDNVRLCKNGEIFRLNQGEIVIVLEGVLAINMLQPMLSGEISEADGHEEPFRVGKGIQGMILGLIEAYGPPIPLQYVAKRKVKIATFNRSQFEALFVQQQKFSYLMKVSAYTLAMILDSYNERNFSSRYSVIRAMIYRYQKQSDEGLLHDNSLASFILSRTKMSRSYLFKILADLKNGGFIDTENGKLVAILKELPEKY